MLMLRIMVNDQGVPNVDGPIDDKILALGLLGIGFLELQKYWATKEKQAAGVEEVSPGQGEALMKALANKKFLS